MDDGALQTAPRTRAERAGTGHGRTVRVWDPMVRVFHWSLVAAFVTAYVTHDDGFSTAHLAAGYVVAGLVAFRVLWGFVGSRHARFTDFVRGPRPTIGYLRGLVTGTAPRTVGHNPAGGAMAVALLVLLSVIALTGWGMTTTAFYADGTLEAIHETAVNLALAAILLHLIGVAASSLAHRENLVRAMITGRKRTDTKQDGRARPPRRG